MARPRFRSLSPRSTVRLVAFPIGIVIAGFIVSGCVSTAAFELVAADVLEAAATNLEQALREYHAESAAADDSRERDIALALVDRLRRDGVDEKLNPQHVSDYLAALERIRADRKTADLRRDHSNQDLAVLREIAGGLRTAGLDALALEQAADRYLYEALANQTPAAKSSPRSPKP